MSTEPTREDAPHYAVQITTDWLGGLKELPKIILSESTSSNSFSKMNGIRIFISNCRRPFLVSNGSEDFTKGFCPVRVDFNEVTVAVVQGERGKPFITYENIFDSTGKLVRHVDLRTLIHAFEEQRLYDPHYDNSQDMASTADPTGGFVCTSSGEKYGWSVIPAQLTNGLTLGQCMSVVMQVRKFTYEAWAAVSDSIYFMLVLNLSICISATLTCQ